MECIQTIRKLKEIGKYDNTIVMFAADNGCAGYINMDRINRKGHYPSYIYRGYKSHGWEGGHRIPFILSWGDRYGHVTDNSLVSLTDLYATFADMLGYRIADDEAEDSFSFWPILDGSGNAARTDLIQRLGRYHADAATVFEAWQRIWLSPEFRAWNIEEYLPRIACPVMAIQGEDDEYGTLDQIDRIAGQARDVDLVKLADCRHSPHKDQPAAVIDAVVGFVARVLDSRG